MTEEESAPVVTREAIIDAFDLDQHFGPRQLDHLFDAFARLSSPAAVGEGMVVVPREPTEAMLDAAFSAYPDSSPQAAVRMKHAMRLDWSAMLAAAPSASAETVPAIPAGMKPWTGGDSAPEDWDGCNVLNRKGGFVCPIEGTPAWTHCGLADEGHAVIAYTPKPTPAAPAQSEVERKPDRIEIARIIDPTAWKVDRDGFNVEQVHSDDALTKADAIIRYLAALSPTGAGEKGEGR